MLFNVVLLSPFCSPFLAHEVSFFLAIPLVIAHLFAPDVGNSNPQGPKCQHSLTMIITIMIAATNTYWRLQILSVHTDKDVSTHQHRCALVQTARPPSTTHQHTYNDHVLH